MPVDPAQPPSDQEKEGRYNSLGAALSAGSQLTGSVVIFFLAGQWFDKRFGTAPWLMLVGAMTGISVGLYLLITELGRRQKRPQGRG